MMMTFKEKIKLNFIFLGFFIQIVKEEQRKNEVCNRLFRQQLRRGFLMNYCSYAETMSSKTTLF